MTEIMIQKMSNKQREQIRWMYLAGYELTDICSKMNLDTDSVRLLVFGLDGTGKDSTCLYHERKHASSAAITAFIMDKVVVLDKITGTATNILAKSLDNLYKEVIDGKELSVDEMSKIAGIVTSLDKIVRLESGMATETMEFIGLSRAEAREILENDPFAPRTVETTSVEVLPWLEKKNEN